MTALIHLTHRSDFSDSEHCKFRAIFTDYNSITFKHGAPKQTPEHIQLDVHIFPNRNVSGPKEIRFKWEGGSVREQLRPQADCPVCDTSE